MEPPFLGGLFHFRGLGLFLFSGTGTFLFLGTGCFSTLIGWDFGHFRGAGVLK